jgi:hypothetical protein
MASSRRAASSNASKDLIDGCWRKNQQDAQKRNYKSAGRDMSEKDVSREIKRLERQGRSSMQNLEFVGGATSCMY